MVELYLHPEIEVMWAQAEQGYSPEQQPLRANTEAVQAAQKLLNDVRFTEESALQHKVGPTLVWLGHIHVCLSSCEQHAGFANGSIISCRTKMSGAARECICFTITCQMRILQKAGRT